MPQRGRGRARSRRRPCRTRPRSPTWRAASAAGALGREALERLIPDTSHRPLLRRAREHLIAHEDDPQAAVPARRCGPGGGDRRDRGHVRADGPATDRDALRTDFLLLERTRLEREVRRARSEDDPRQSELATGVTAGEDRDGNRDGTSSVSEEPAAGALDEVEEEETRRPLPALRRGRGRHCRACPRPRPRAAPRTPSASTCTTSAASRCSPRTTRSAWPSASSRTT